jgi:hypothetical protein
MKRPCGCALCLDSAQDLRNTQKRQSVGQLVCPRTVACEGSLVSSKPKSCDPSSDEEGDPGQVDPWPNGTPDSLRMDS